MTAADRRLRDREAQRLLITTTARSIAENEGWSAVTTRRLSAEIEYSQPVIYKHFASLDAIAEAVALEGFDELTAALRSARQGAASDPARAVAHAYAAFAAGNPAVYDAMFVRRTRLAFAAEEPPAPLGQAFDELRESLGDAADETLVETFWAGLHGLVTLGSNGRLRASHHVARIDLLVDRFRLR